jgi:predicted CoA-substrate-specific enzyme activase
MYAGIDIGSVTTKAVIISAEGEVLAFSARPTTSDRHKSGADILDTVLKQIKQPRESVKYIVSTGYGRRSFTASDKALPEIICHARGTKHLYPEVRTIIDIGGQDSKVIEMDETGNINKFEMNDKCAAGTGRFLEVLSDRILNIPLEELGPVSLESTRPSTLSSVCTIFAESEIISLLSENKAKEDIAYGLHMAIAKRVIGMGRSGAVAYQEPIVFSGGVARNVGVIKAIEQELGKPVLVPENPQITAALGAALAGKDNGK